MALIIIPGLSESVSAVTTMPGAGTPRAIKACGISDMETVSATFLRDTCWKCAKDRDRARVNIHVLNVDLVIEMEFRTMKKERI
jgi:hypothetical protein